MTNKISIQSLAIGSMFNYKNKRLQLASIDFAHERFIAVDPNTEPHLRSKEFLQTWIKKDTMVDPIPDAQKTKFIK